MSEEYDFSHATRGNSYQPLVKRPVKIETADGFYHSVSIKTIELTATVAPNGTLTLQLPQISHPESTALPSSFRKIKRRAELSRGVADGLWLRLRSATGIN